MNTYLILAACLTILIGLVHSILGEWLIFTKLREHGVVPSLPAEPLELRNIRILWATWHLASVFGLAIAAVLFHVATHPIDTFIIYTVSVAMLSSAGLVLWASRGKHPGWVGLLAVSLLCYLAY